MCGIFGMVRSIHATHSEKASAVLIELGKRAVERGRDSSGLAFIPRTEFASKTVYEATSFHARTSKANLDGVIVVKGTGTFDKFWNDREYLPALTASQVVLGHTRAATQGNKSKLENASPLAAGYVVGTHNGDIDPDSVPSHLTLKRDLVGGTDTEYLYRAINSKNSHRKKITDILTSIKGRAALAWIDRRTTNRLYLARAALSPMAVAYDAEGNFYWASNPAWFRDIDAKFDHSIGFHSISMVTEGTLITIDYGTGEAVVEDVRSFTPTARYTDGLLGDGIIWRNFDDDDAKTDKDQATHLVDDETKWKGYTTSTARHAGSRVGTGSGYTTYAGQPSLLDHEEEYAYIPQSQELEHYQAGGNRAMVPEFRGGSEEYYNPAADRFEPADSESIFGNEVYDIPEDVTDEVQTAVLEWADKGMNRFVVQACQEAISDEDFDRLAKDFALGTREAARLFKREVLIWDSEVDNDLLSGSKGTSTADDLDFQVAQEEAKVG